MSPVVTWSIVALSVLVFAAGFWISGETAQRRFPRLHNFSLVIQLAAATVGYLALRPGGHDDKRSIVSAQHAGVPVLVTIHSNY